MTIIKLNIQKLCNKEYLRNEFFGTPLNTGKRMFGFQLGVYGGVPVEGGIMMIKSD